MNSKNIISNKFNLNWSTLFSYNTIFTKIIKEPSKEAWGLTRQKV